MIKETSVRVKVDQYAQEHLKSDEYSLGTFDPFFDSHKDPTPLYTYPY